MTMANTNPVISDRQKTDNGLVVKAKGEIDLIRSPRLRTELMQVLEKGVPVLVLDLSDVPFMDSSGVATLVEALQVQRKKGNKLVLCGLQQKVRSIFEIARLDMVFTITEDVQKAGQV